MTVVNIPTERNCFLDAALSYAQRGWRVLPCKGKVPLTAHGFHDASSEPEQLRIWWHRWPDANVGLRTGSVSGVFVVDIDPKSGGDDAFDDLLLEHGLPDDTVQSVTGGGGAHYFFAYPTDGIPVPSTAGRVARGVDVRGDSGYAILPPSVHAETGHVYGWAGMGP